MLLGCITARSDGGEDMLGRGATACVHKAARQLHLPYAATHITLGLVMATSKAKRLRDNETIALKEINMPSAC